MCAGIVKGFLTVKRFIICVTAFRAALRRFALRYLNSSTGLHHPVVGGAAS